MRKTTKGYRRCGFPTECHRRGPWSDRFYAYLCRHHARLALRFAHPSWLRAHPSDGPIDPTLLIWLVYRPEIARQMFEPHRMWLRLRGEPVLNRRGLPYIRKRQKPLAIYSGGRSITMPLHYAK
jgi:hypothetical protein